MASSEIPVTVEEAAEEGCDDGAWKIIAYWWTAMGMPMSTAPRREANTWRCGESMGDAKCAASTL